MCYPPFEQPGLACYKILLHVVVQAFNLPPFCRTECTTSLFIYLFIYFRLICNNLICININIYSTCPFKVAR